MPGTFIDKLMVILCLIRLLESSRCRVARGNGVNESTENPPWSSPLWERGCEDRGDTAAPGTGQDGHSRESRNRARTGAGQVLFLGLSLLFPIALSLSISATPQPCLSCRTLLCPYSMVCPVGKVPLLAFLAMRNKVRAVLQLWTQ